MKEVFFRADGNKNIASGHLMRCMAVADALKNFGVMSSFIVADDQSLSLINERGYTGIVLNSQWNHPNGEVDKLINLVREKNIKYLVIDHYFVNEDYFALLAAYTKIIYFNDLFQKPFLADMIISYGNISTYIDYDFIYEKSEKKPIILQGRKYVPLQKNFESSNFLVKKEVKNVLLTTGGADSYNIMENLAEEFCCDKKMKCIKFHIVVGKYMQNEKRMKEIQKNNPNIILHEHINNLKNIMINCDIAISAGGTTLYELCAVGVPTICFSIAENQKGLVEEMERRNIMLCAGSIDDGKEKIIANIKKMFALYSNSYQLRKDCSQKMKCFIDGQGARRIADVLNQM